MVDFLKEQGFSILSAIILAIATFLGSRIKAKYEAIMADKTKKDVVKNCVKAVEQLYNGMAGPEKFEKAKENIIFILNEKGINISDLELTMLIESVVSEFNFINFSEANVQLNISEGGESTNG